MKSFYLHMISYTLGLSLLLGGCKQGEGERCQLEGDCDDELTCCVDPGNRAFGGICLPQDKCELSAFDGGVNDAELEDQMASSEGLVDGGTADAEPKDSQPDHPLVDSVPLDKALVPDSPMPHDTSTIKDSELITDTL